MTFYLSIIAYISSVIAALVLMITGKTMAAGKFRWMAGVHLFCGIVFILSILLTGKGPSVEHPNFFFLLFICTGTCLSALAWRTRITKAEKSYFSLFIVTFPLFLFSPSMLVNFLLTTRYTDSIGKKFPLQGAYALEKQNSWTEHGSEHLYKVVLQRGIFHQTIARDVDFGGEIDSVKVVRFDINDSVRIRAYIIKESYVDTQMDSFEVTVPMKTAKRNLIERRL
jgi:hypothetical protein